MVTSTADTLRQIANLIDGGMPVPISIVTYGKTAVQVRVDDLGWWLTRMDVPEPDWHGDAGCPLHARWPEGTFDAHPWTLACVSTAGVAVA